MRTASLLLLGAGVLLAPACRNGPSGPTLQLPAAEATATCGPTDGPAVSILLATAVGDSPTPPLVRVVVYQPRAALAGHGWLLSGDQAAAMLQRAGEFEPLSATGGRLQVDTVGADGTIDGRLWALFADGTRVAQRFHAPWRESTAMCG